MPEIEKKKTLPAKENFFAEKKKKKSKKSLNTW